MPNFALLTGLEDAEISQKQFPLFPLDGADGLCPENYEV